MENNITKRKRGYHLLLIIELVDHGGLRVYLVHLGKSAHEVDG
jgi:hypothetical protein